jgi:hypothetical protein
MRKTRHIGLLCAAGLTGLLMAGCAAVNRPPDVPSTAMNKAEGDQRLVYTAADPGTVWVTEGATDIVYSAPVAAGDRVVVDPDANKILVNGQVVLDKDVVHVDHKVFFLPGAAPPAADAQRGGGQRSAGQPARRRAHDGTRCRRREEPRRVHRPAGWVYLDHRCGSAFGLSIRHRSIAATW